LPESTLDQVRIKLKLKPDPADIVVEPADDSENEEPTPRSAE
jgi:hypothetical protein